MIVNLRINQALYKGNRDAVIVNSVGILVNADDGCYCQNKQSKGINRSNNGLEHEEQELRP